MHQTESLRRCSMAVALAMAVLLLPGASVAQLGGLLPPPPTITTSSVTGDASVVRSTVLGMTTALGDTGTLSGINQARDASMLLGSISPALSGETLSASTISWANEVDSEASLTNLNMTVAGIGLTADLVMAQASQIVGSAGSGSSTLSNLAINGLPINVTGAPNQTISIPGGRVILNEQTVSSTGAAVVNALHVSVLGVADVVIASATAGIS
jgi:hypothetical protein